MLEEVLAKHCKGEEEAFLGERVAALPSHPQPACMGCSLCRRCCGLHRPAWAAAFCLAACS